MGNVTHTFIFEVICWLADICNGLLVMLGKSRIAKLSVVGKFVRAIESTIFQQMTISKPYFT